MSRRDALQLSLFKPPPKYGEVVNDLDVFSMHLCDKVRICPHREQCMQQPVGPDARCFWAVEKSANLSSKEAAR